MNKGTNKQTDPKNRQRGAGWGMDQMGEGKWQMQAFSNGMNKSWE